MLDFSWEGVDMTAGDQDQSSVSKRTVWSQSMSLSKLYSFSSAKIKTWKHQSSYSHQGTRYGELSKIQDFFFKSLTLFLKCYTSFGIRKCPLFKIDTWIPEWRATKSSIQLIRSWCYVILVIFFLLVKYYCFGVQIFLFANIISREVFLDLVIFFRKILFFQQLFKINDLYIK